MRALSCVLLAAIPMSAILFAGCATDGGEDDLGSVVGRQGRRDARSTRRVTIPAVSSATEPGEKSYTVHASGDFDGQARVRGRRQAKLIVDRTGGDIGQEPAGHAADARGQP